MYKQLSVHIYQEMCDELEELLKKVKNKKVREIKKEELPDISEKSRRVIDYH